MLSREPNSAKVINNFSITLTRLEYILHDPKPKTYDHSYISNTFKKYLSMLSKYNKTPLKAAQTFRKCIYTEVQSAELSKKFSVSGCHPRSRRFSNDRIEPVHEISNIVLCASSKASDQPAHTRSLIRAFASRLSIL